MISSQVNRVCLFTVLLVFFLNSIRASTTVRTCHNTRSQCENGETEKGSCSIGGVTVPRCCKTTGKDDHCDCKSACLPSEYQKDDCGAGYVCCPKRSQWYDPDKVHQW